MWNTSKVLLKADKVKLIISNFSYHVNTLLFFQKTERLYNIIKINIYLEIKIWQSWWWEEEIKEKDGSVNGKGKTGFENINVFGV
jgi:hypothetical protein